MADDIVQVDLLHTNIVIPSQPLPPTANATILAFLKDNLTPSADWDWEENGDRYTLNVDDTQIITISVRQFKNSTLEDNDVSRYQKIIDKKL